MLLRSRGWCAPLRTGWTTLTLLLAVGWGAPASAAVLYVDRLAAGNDDGSSWIDAFVDLQDALAAATVGDSVWVAQGTYYPTSDLDRTVSFQLKSGVAIFGGFAGGETDPAERDWLANPTILSGDIGVPDTAVFHEFESLIARGVKPEDLAAWLRRRAATKKNTDNSYHVVDGSGADDTAVLTGFTITRGAAEGVGLAGDGGGMLNVAGSPTLTDLAFVANTADVQGGGMANHAGSAPKLTNVQFSNWSEYVAGGMFNDASSPVLEDVLFESNVAAVSGGGMQNRGGSAPSLTAVTFAGNAADDVGGGMTNDGSSPLLADVVFLQNFAGSAGGGGMANRSGSAPQLIDVTFDGNVAFGFSGGGGMRNEQSNPILQNVVFTGNTTGANQGGGGVANCGSSPVLTGVVFFENSAVAFGGGMANYEASAPQLINVTFARNFTTFAGGWGGAIYNHDSSPVLVNSICWDDSSGPGRDEIFNDGGVPIISSSLVGGSGGSEAWDAALGLDGGANLDVDPLFVDGPGGDLRLMTGSAAVDTGVDGAAALIVDLDGNPRVAGAAIDLGGYELPCEPLAVVLGTQTGGMSLQDVLDGEYGSGAIDALQDHLAAQCASGNVPYWFTGAFDAWTVRVLASDGSVNEFGWHVETFEMPVIDGTDDGIVLEGVIQTGDTGSALLPGGFARIGFYLNPNGPGDADGAPEPETFFLNRIHNDAGPDGAGDLRPPDGPDPQCLVYDVSDYYNGRPTYVLAWEDDDYAGPLTPLDSLSTEFLFQDLVLEMRVMLPVPAVAATLAAARVTGGVELRWEIEDITWLDRLEIRRDAERTQSVLVSWQREAIVARGAWIDHEAPLRATYRLVGIAGGVEVFSQPVQTPAASLWRARLVAASPNPFNPSTRVTYTLPRAERIALDVLDASGRLVRRLVYADKEPGEHAVTWDGRDEDGVRVASGVYTLRLRAGASVDARRVVLLK